MKKFIFICFLCFNFQIALFSETLNDTQCIKEGHWIYDALKSLGNESRLASLYDNAPLSVGEIKFHFSEIDYEKLSESGKYLYSQVNDYLYENENLLQKLGYDIDVMRFAINIRANPEFMFKSNPEIDWTYRYAFVDRLLTAPISVGFSNYFTFQVDPYLAKNYVGMQRPTNFTNIPLAFDEIEFHIPEFAIGTAGMYFDNWGFDFKVGHTGLTIGNTATGSIIYNNTFETDSYVQLNVFNHYAKYNMNLVQISVDKFLYLHEISVRLFKKFNIQVLEGTLIAAPFELRYLNPLMPMHSLASWNDYGAQENNGNNDYLKYYDESHCCAYLAAVLNFVPIDNLRLYLLYAQNELIVPNEPPYKPNSFGIQSGFEYAIPAFDNGFWQMNTEVVYTTPYLYIKQAPQWSMYRTRVDVQNKTMGPIKSWVGTPFGPDTFAVQASFGYKKQNKWEANLGYIFSVHGENGFSIFDSEPDENGIYHYYPFSWAATGDPEQIQKAYDASHNLWMTGVNEIKNQIILNGKYYINNHFYLSGQGIYTFVFNNKNVLGNFQQGVELSFALTYSLY